MGIPVEVSNTLLRRNNINSAWIHLIIYATSVNQCPYFSQLSNRCFFLNFPFCINLFLFSTMTVCRIVTWSTNSRTAGCDATISSSKSKVQLHSFDLLWITSQRGSARHCCKICSCLLWKGLNYVLRRSLTPPHKSTRIRTI